MKDTIKAGIITLGCRVNQYESDAIMQELAKNGVTICPPDDVCDIYVINTCTVTAESDRKSRQFIRRCISKNKDAIIIVTGCYAQINPKAVLKTEGVDFVCGNNAKSMIPKKALELLKNKNGEKSFIPPITDAKFDKMSVGVPMTRTRAFVKIEDGCESKCAYCIIPSARGNVRSDSKENILSEVKKIAEGGCREVVLTGIETSSYGKDFQNGYGLADLMCDIQKIDGIERIRLGSVDPASMGKEFTDKIKNLSKVMPHFHVSMQTGCNKILGLMRRRYNIETVEKNLNYLRENIPDIMFSADVITGFPGETDEDFEKTVEFFKKQKFLRLHIFPYSKRSGTVASTMPNQVDDCVKKQRLRTLSEEETQIRKELLCEYVKTHETAKVLFEANDGEFATGHTENFIEVRVKTDAVYTGMIKTVKLVSSDSEYVYGETI